MIYGEGAVGLPLAQPVIYHGRFGSGLFQTIYRQNRYSPWAYFTLLEWHVVALILLVLGLLWPPLAVGAGVMWVLTLAAAGRWAWAAPLGPEAPWWCRPMVFAMHLLQPVVRSSRRYLHRLGAKHLPLAGGDLPREDHLKPISPRVEDVYWESERGRGREALLEELVSEAASSGWRGVEGSAWMADDLAMSGDRWHKVRLRTASEELGSGRRFTRVRCFWRWTYATCCVIALAAVLTMIVMLVSPVIGGIVAAGLWGMIVTNLWQSRMDCRRSLFNLIWRAGHRARLNPVRVRPGVAAAAALEPEPSEVAAA